MNQQRKNIDCRVCLRCDLKQTTKCFSLFENYNSSLISEKIKYVANVEINEGDGLPTKICPDCLLQLETAILFKQKCETSNKILHSVLQQPSKVCKVTFRVPVKREVEVVFDNNAVNNLNTVDYLNATDHHNADYFADDPEPIKSEISEDYEVNTCESKELETFIEVDPVITNVEANTESINVDVEDTAEKEVKKSRVVDLKLICDDCGGTFRSKCKLAVHWKQIHLHTKLVCPSCKRVFKSFKAFNIHKNKKTRSCLAAAKVHIEGEGRVRVFHCKDCSYHTRRIKDMDAHLTTHTGDRRFQCHDCFKCFTQHSSLQGHRESHHKDYKIETTCQYCGILIQGRNKYYKHLRKHLYKTVQCDICKKTLKNRTTLAMHLKRHSGVREHTCETCSANFYSSAELCNHRKKVHLKARTYKCDMCEYSMYTAVALKMHRSRHTQNNVVCMYCGIFVDSEEKLVIHHKTHLEKNFSCTQCDKGFYRRDSLRRHLLRLHGVTEIVEPIKVVSVVSIKQERPTDNKFDA